MASTAADILLDRLIHWGVDTVFSFPGDGINGIFESLRKRKDKLRYVQVRHEEAAAFAACGYAKYAGRLGVCAAERCDRVYVDTSRNATRRFCSTACQSRTKAAAFRARR